MNKKLFIAVFSMITLALIFFSQLKIQQPIQEQKYQGNDFDLVVYGGGPQAVASAIKAATVSKDKMRIAMIVPENKLGSILTAGGQNLFDLRQHQSKELPKGLPNDYEWAQGGTMYNIFKDTSIVFSVDRMKRRLEDMVAEHRNITVFYLHDINKIDTYEKKIVSVNVAKLVLDENGRYIYDKNAEKELTSKIFIDASETGKLTYGTGMYKGVIGRGDTNLDNKQMVATLMFKLKGINMKYVQKHQKENSPFIFYFSHKGSLGTLGGYEVKGNSKFDMYSKQNGDFRIKPYNGGEDGYSGKNKQNANTEMWMNMLLIYDVDARKMWRDKIDNNGFYPKDGGLDPEIAREKSIEEIKSKKFIELIRTIPGLENSTLVLDDKKKPVVGEIMYLRESIHASNQDGSFALTKSDTVGLKDSRHYRNRIGLGFYNFDSNTYAKGEDLTEPRTFEPWYVPYDVLISTPENLLISGYAANIDSYTWRAMRVYPNLLVLGDAAGVAAGLTYRDEFNIKNPTEKEINRLQDSLIENNAILEK